MAATPEERRRGWIDDIADLETMDIIAFNDLVNPYGEGDQFAAGGFRLGRRFFRDAVKRWGFSEIGWVADVICGFGRWAMFLAEANDRVCGYDANGNCVSLASKLAAHLGLENATFEIAWADAIPVPEGIFDGVWLFNGMHYLERDQTLREMYRILRAGGRLLLGHYATIAGMLFGTFMIGYRRGGLKDNAAQFALRALAEGPFFDGRGNFYACPETMAAVFDRYGFELADQAALRVPTEATETVDQGFPTDLKDLSALATRLASDDAFAKAFVDSRDARSSAPMHIDLLAIKKAE